MGVDKKSSKLMRLAERVAFQPRAVIREVVDDDPWYGQVEILLGFSLASGLLALRTSIEMMLIEVMLNLILMVLTTYSMAALLWLTGRLLGGRASYAALAASMIWPMVPSIVGILAVLPFQDLTPWGFPLPDIVQLLFLLFSFHLMVQTVAEVEGFGAWKSVCSQLLALGISLLPVWIFWGQIQSIFQRLLPL